MTVKVLVTVTQVFEDGTEGPVDGELAVALAGPAEQFAGMLTWTAQQAGRLDHGEREKTVAEPGRELQRQVLEATFAAGSAREQRTVPVTSAAGIRHGTVEAGHGRGVVSIFGPVRAERMAYRNRREANLYPADARWVLPEDPYSMGMRAHAAYHLAEGGYGQAQEVIKARTGVTVGRAQLAGLAQDLADWAGEFYDQWAFGADTDLPASDVIMMQADGKGIAVRPGHRASRASDAAHPGIKKMAEIVAVAGFTPAVREPEDIAAPPARRKERPGPQARDKWVAASITESIEDITGPAFNKGDRRDPYGTRQRVFLADGNKQQLTAIADHAKARGLKVSVFIDFIHVSGYLGKAAAALHSGDPQAAREWADGQRLRVLHGRAKAVAATLASVAARTRAKNSRLDLTDVDKAVTYLTNNHMHMRYDKALAAGWPIATGMIEGACRFVIEDRSGITGARWSPDDADVILKLRAVVVNDDLDEATLPQGCSSHPLRPRQHPRPRPHRMTETPGNVTPLREAHPMKPPLNYPKVSGRSRRPRTNELSQIRRRRLVDVAHDEIRRQIVSGGFPMGSPLNEVHVARSLGTSRAPVREAIRRLAEEGLVVERAHQVALVSDIDAGVMVDLYNVRVGLETVAIRLATKRGMPVTELKKIVSKISATAKRGRPSQVARCELDFHAAICEGSGNKILSQMFGNLESMLLMALTFDDSLYDNLYAVADEHLPLIEAIESGDDQRAGVLMHSHIVATIPKAIESFGGVPHPVLEPIEI